MADVTLTLPDGSQRVFPAGVTPAEVAADIAMLDHMLDGRLNFGISPGGLATDAEVFGNLDKDRPSMFLEGINTVLKIWESEAPYNIDTQHFGRISTEKAQSSQGMSASTSEVSTVAPHQMRRPEGASR